LTSFRDWSEHAEAQRGEASFVSMNPQKYSQHTVKKYLDQHFLGLLLLLRRQNNPHHLLLLLLSLQIDLHEPAERKGETKSLRLHEGFAHDSTALLASVVSNSTAQERLAGASLLPEGF